MHDLHAEIAEELSVRKPDWFRHAEQDARAFIGSLALDNTAPIVLLKESDRLGEIGMYEPYSTIAHCNNYEPLIFVRRQAARSVDRYDEHLLGSVLVHELMHSTAPAGTHVLRKRPDGSILEDHRAGLLTEHAGKPLGLFFEEGLAEFTAGWYRRAKAEGLVPTVDIGINEIPAATLPDHYSYRGMLAISGPDGYAIELMAWGMQRRHILRHASDLVGMMLETRHPQTQTQALREFAQTVEQLEPGLYIHLRNLEYSAENWYEACRGIQGIVARAGRGRLRSLV